MSPLRCLEIGLIDTSIQILGAMGSPASITASRQSNGGATAGRYTLFV